MFRCKFPSLSHDLAEQENNIDSWQLAELIQQHYVDFPPANERCRTDCGQICI